MDQPLPAMLRTGAMPPAAADWRMLVPNLLLFQVGWFAAVLGAANGMAWLGPAVIALVLAIHLARARQRGNEAALIVLVLATGFAFESFLAGSGWVAYPDHASTGAPLWMIALWANFAATLNVSLRSLRARSWLLAALGGIGGPLAYWGGANLGAMQWLETAPVLVSLALGWATITPLLGRLALKLDGYRHDD